MTRRAACMLRPCPRSDREAGQKGEVTFREAVRRLPASDAERLSRLF